MQQRKEDIYNIFVLFDMNVWRDFMISPKTILCVYEILKKYPDENYIISVEKTRETESGL